MRSTRRRDRCAAAIAGSLLRRFGVILLLGDGRWIEGPARETLTSETLSELYLTPMVEIATPGRRVFVNA